MITTSVVTAGPAAAEDEEVVERVIATGELQSAEVPSFAQPKGVVDFSIAGLGRLSGAVTRIYDVPVAREFLSSELGGGQRPKVLRSVEVIYVSEAVFIQDSGLEHTGTLGIWRAENAQGVVGSFGDFSLSGRSQSRDGNVVVEFADASKISILDDVDRSRDTTLDLVDEPDPEELDEPEAQISKSGQSPHVIDILFAYTTTARINAGSASTLESTLDAHLALATIFADNSGINVEFNNVGFYEVPGHTSNSSSTLLDDVRDPNDAVWDDVPQMKDLLGADIAVLVDYGASIDNCGLASVASSQSFKTYNFRQGFLFLMDRADCRGIYTLAHELGHVLGGGHNIANNGYYSDSAGFSAQNYRTVISNAQVQTTQWWYSTTNPDLACNCGAVGAGDRENDRAMDVFSNLLDQSRYSARDYVDRAVVYGSGGSKSYRVNSNGRVTASGGAPHLGDPDNLNLAAPIVGIETDRDGHGYYLVASDGGIFAYGATYYGSAGAINLNSPVVDMATDPDGSGYWLVAADGGVFAYSATFHGSAGGINLNDPVVAISSRASGSGYYLLALDGGVFSYNASFYGSTPSGANSLHRPAVDLVPTSNGLGYTIVSAYGRFRAFGNASFPGSWSRSDGDLVTGMDSDGNSLFLVDRGGTLKTK